MTNSPNRWLCGVLLAVGCLALSGSRGEETPAPWDGSASHGFIYSVLQRDDAIFASTNTGIHRAALTDKVWHKLPLPDPAPMNGHFAREAAASSVLVYYTRRFGFESPKDRPPVMYVSKNLGQTWELTSSGRNFYDVFVDSDGNFYADERMETPDPPPHQDNDTSSWTTERNGQTMHIWHHVVVSHDSGKTWRDISEGLPPRYVYHILRSLDHPDLIRVAGGREGHASGGGFYEADDQQYHWKEVSWKVWRRDPDERQYIFGSLTPGSNNREARADLSTLFKYPFLKWNNELNLHAVQIETEKPAYTFRQDEPMPVALKVYFVFSREPLRFADNEDETVCWALRGYPVDGDTFHSSAKAGALNVGTPDGEARFAAYRDDPGGRIVTLDNEHPYRRTVDLAKLYHFPGPGRYRVQPVKTFCVFFKDDAGFAGQVIDVTVTP